MNARILVVTDEHNLEGGFADLLRTAGYDVVTAEDSTTGLRLALEESFHLLIVDARLPDVNGIGVCAAIREGGHKGPVLMVTDSPRVQERGADLPAGLYEYVSIPCAPQELLARAAALLQRTRGGGAVPSLFRLGGTLIDFEHHEVLREGKRISLAYREVQLLRYLVSRRGEVVSRSELLTNVWPDQRFISPRTVDTHVSWIRQKIEEDSRKPTYLATVRGRGYCLDSAFSRFAAGREAANLTGERADGREILFLSSMAENMQEAILLIDAGANLRFVNTAFCNLLGYSPLDCQHRKMFELDQAFTAAHWDTQWRELLRAGSLVVERLFRARDGRLISVELSSTPIVHGGEQYCLNFLRDLSLEKALRHSAAPRAPMTNFPNLVARFDASGRHVFVNTNLLRTLGVSFAEILGKTLLDVDRLCDKKTRRLLDQSIRQSFESATPNTVEVLWNTPDGPHCFNVLHIPETDRAGKVVTVLGISRDVTRQERSGAELAGSRRYLRATMECKAIMTVAADEAALLSAACKLICTLFGYKCAWIGYGDAASTLPLSVVSAFAVSSDFLMAVEASGYEESDEWSPEYSSMHARRSIYCADFLARVEGNPELLEAATQTKLRSCVALPLIDEPTRLCGCLAIYEEEVGAFAPEELYLLECVARDLTTAIAKLRTNSGTWSG